MVLRVLTGKMRLTLDWQVCVKRIFPVKEGELLVKMK